MGDIKKINKQHYKWTNDSEDNNNIFIDFLSQLEKQSDWKGKITVGDNNVMLVASSIMRLSDYLNDGSINYGPINYDDVERLIFQIGLQISILHKYNKGIFFLSLDDIIVIDKNFFLLSSLQHVLNIKDNKLMLTYPMKFSKKDEMFLAPEVLNVKKVLPFIISISVGYYSLAKLCIYCLGLGGDMLLGSIMGSKMYFFLERCLAKEPDERTFLYI
jgi:hypothetical protein